MTDRAAPYPAETRARGWRFEIDMEAIKASDTWLLAKTGAMRGALLLLWSEAWQQTPCGTLPNDDELIALLIDMPVSTFQKNRKTLMRGWYEASDGRLYHETITKRVLSMLDKRANDAKRAANRRARATASAVTHGVVTDASRVTRAGSRSEFDTKHQAPEPVIEEEPTVLVDTPAAPRPSPCPTDQIVEMYHRHLPTLPRVEVLSDTRKRAVAARWREVLADKDIRERPDPRSAALDFFDWYFGHAASSAFLTGRAKDWRADFDFLVTPSKWVKVIEGHYHREKA